MAADERGVDRGERRRCGGTVTSTAISSLRAWPTAATASWTAAGEPAASTTERSAPAVRCRRGRAAGRRASNIAAKGTSRPLIRMFRTSGPLRSLASVTVKPPPSRHCCCHLRHSPGGPRRRNRKALTNAPTSWPPGRVHHRWAGCPTGPSREIRPGSVTHVTDVSDVGFASVARRSRTGRATLGEDTAYGIRHTSVRVTGAATVSSSGPSGRRPRRRSSARPGPA